MENSKEKKKAFCLEGHCALDFASQAMHHSWLLTAVN